ncbi:MAG TPA: DinB family protein [Armatimonadota bacterium]|nr:DinB family protein [Armatimonadota bacterium]
MLETYLEALELGYYEATFAFKGLADSNVWKRPAPELLSVGELAGHVAYWEAVKFAGNGRDPAMCRVSSPLIDRRFDYYPGTIATPPSAQHVAMTAEQTLSELVRIHREAVAHLRALNPDLASHPPGFPPQWAYAELLKYAPFHVAYHVGQMYSVRLLLGEDPPDN